MERSRRRTQINGDQEGTSENTTENPEIQILDSSQRVQNNSNRNQEGTSENKTESPEIEIIYSSCEHSIKSSSERNSMFYKRFTELMKNLEREKDDIQVIKEFKKSSDKNSSSSKDEVGSIEDSGSDDIKVLFEGKKDIESLGVVTLD